MDPAPALYAIRIKGHLGATVLSAFPALVPQRHGTDTVLTGLLDRSALYGAAQGIFGQLGAAPWAARASSELRATGQPAAHDQRPNPVTLTPQQREITSRAALRDVLSSNEDREEPDR